MALGLNSFYTKKTLMSENIKVRNTVQIESTNDLIAILNLSRTEKWLKIWNSQTAFKVVVINLLELSIENSKNRELYKKKLNGRLDYLDL